MRRYSSFLVLLLVAVPAFAQSKAPYLQAGQIESINLVPPPPPPDSERQRADLDGVLAMQKSRTAVQSKRAQEDRPNLSAFLATLGPGVTAEKLPRTSALLAQVTRETGAQVDRVKDCWERPRPFVVSKEVTPLGTMAQGMAIQPGAEEANVAPHEKGWPCKPVEKPAYTYSYPSGQASSGTAISIVLAAMVPEKRAELFTRGWELGENRIIGGVHFPSDVEYGRVLATTVLGLMMQNPAFTTDLAAARSELRAALNLAP